VLFRSGHLSQVVGVELADGRTVVIKARPAGRRIAGCVAVQRHLAHTGFPCPEPLTDPVQARGLTVTAEVLVPGGSQLPAEGGAAPFAALLARLVSSAPAPAAVPALAPSPPWTGWDHRGSRLWPDFDDRGRDLTAAPGPAWVDDAAGQVRDRLSACGAPARAGHGDWESQNIRWHGDEPLVVHDWDSVIAQPEATIVGLAAAVWAAEGRSGGAADVAQTTDFISAYERVRGPLSRQDRAAAWAAGLWVRLFNAKKDATKGGGPNLHRLRGELHERLQHAGLDP
jgi:hypothetical protein